MTDERRKELLDRTVDWMNTVLLDETRRVSIMRDVIGMTDEEMYAFGVTVPDPFEEEQAAFMMDAILTRKPDRMETERCRIVKAVYITAAEFNEMKQRPLACHDFIRDNADLMGVDSNTGSYRCILVTSEATDDAIIIKSEGANYARYAAYVPAGRHALEEYLAHCSDEMYDRIMGGSGEGQAMTQ